MDVFPLVRSDTVRYRDLNTPDLTLMTPSKQRDSRDVTRILIEDVARKRLITFGLFHDEESSEEGIAVWQLAIQICMESGIRVIIWCTRAQCVVYGRRSRWGTEFVLPY